MTKTLTWVLSALFIMSSVVYSVSASGCDEHYNGNAQAGKLKDPEEDVDSGGDDEQKAREATMGSGSDSDSKDEDGTEGEKKRPSDDEG